MSFLLKDRIHQSLAETVYNEFLSRRSNYYYFIGKVLNWPNPLVPPSPEVTADYEYETRRQILQVKKVNVNDVSLVVKRINWVTNTVYDQFDGNYSSSFKSSTGASSLKDSNYYVLTSQFNVYKCLFNKNGAASTVEPTNFDPTPLTTADGYIWKYMYTVPLSVRNRFLTTDYMPVQRAVTNAYYSNGEIRSIVLDNQGSGYIGNNVVTLTVNGSFLGGNGNVIANLTPVLNTSGEIISVYIDNAGNNYKQASITVNDTSGLGTSHFKGLSNVKITSTGTNYYTNVVANTIATIATTGAVQPTSNALANLIFSSNSLVDIVITNKGYNYTAAAQANTTITISTTGNSQPTSNATANLYFANTAILTPIMVAGQVYGVTIEDEGINYPSNIQTTISVIGDGKGAVLTPFVNSAGQVQDIIIEDSGHGYTHVNLAFASATGTGANAYVNTSIGGVETIQSIVELSAVNGGIFAFRVANVGTGYSYANVSVTGDGRNFAGNVVLSNNTVSYITVQNPGAGYSYANTTIIGDGGNANVSAILSPVGGHGKDSISELFADAIMFTSTINNEKNQGLNVSNDYRQFGILKDIKANDSGYHYANVNGSACFLATLESVTGLNRDSLLSLTTTNSVRHYQIVEVVSSTKQILVVDLNNHNLVAGDILTDENTAATYTVASLDQVPDIDVFSGDLLYIDNRTSVSHSDQQLVTLRTIIRL